MAKYGFVLWLAIIISLQAEGCRFTVREIGFSILSRDIYTLAVIDEDANPDDNYWKQIHKKNRDCNLRLEILNPIADASHPIIASAKELGISFPSTILVSPIGELMQLNHNESSRIYQQVIDSPIREKMRKSFPELFAIVVWVEGENIEQNHRIAQKIQDECNAIENIMPNMPKVVGVGPSVIHISENDFAGEEVLMWSLGLDSLPEEPVAFVLYGRGRIMGTAITYNQVMDGDLYKYMSMIGADCECGLDRKWMLGNQIPLLWSAETSQQLANLVGFDVDNPMILAEMSRILAKETLEDATGSVAFAPETIDLDEVFGKHVESKKVEKTTELDSYRSIIYTAIALLLIILIGAGIVFYKFRTKN